MQLKLLALSRQIKQPAFGKHLVVVNQKCLKVYAKFFEGRKMGGQPLEIFQLGPIFGDEDPDKGTAYLKQMQTWQRQIAESRRESAAAPKTKGRTRDFQIAPQIVVSADPSVFAAFTEECPPQVLRRCHIFLVSKDVFVASHGIPPRLGVRHVYTMGEESSLVVMRSEAHNRRFAVMTVWKYAMGKLDLSLPSLYDTDNHLNQQSVESSLDALLDADKRAPAGLPKVTTGYTNMFDGEAAKSPTRWLEVAQPSDNSSGGVNEMLYAITAFEQLEQLSKWEKNKVGSLYTIYAGEGPTVQQIISRLREPTGVHESAQRMLELCNAWYERARPDKETYQLLTNLRAADPERQRVPVRRDERQTGPPQRAPAQNRRPRGPAQKNRRRARGAGELHGGPVPKPGVHARGRQVRQHPPHAGHPRQHVPRRAPAGLEARVRCRPHPSQKEHAQQLLPERRAEPPGHVVRDAAAPQRPAGPPAG